MWFEEISFRGFPGKFWQNGGGGGDGGGGDGGENGPKTISPPVTQGDLINLRKRELKKDYKKSECTH